MNQERRFDYDDIEATLPRKGDVCTLEYFQSQEEADGISHRKANEIQKKIYIDEMKVNPSEFFNFGFNADDYFLFLVKYSVMRAERQMIEQEYTKYLRKKGINLD